jgi:SAM-dependent methyltransferase
LRFAKDFLLRYLEVTPAALALERSLECDLHARNSWKSPVLDIGCGDGLFASILCADRIDTGIDPDAGEIEHARTTGAYKELIACFGNDIAKPDGSYETIISNSVLEHIPDLLPVLKEARRLLAEGGTFYVTVPSDRFELANIPARLLAGAGLASLAQRYGKFYNRFWRHYHAYDDIGWRALFGQAGLEVVEHCAYDARNVTTFCDFLTFVSIPSLISKKLLNRWVLLPAVRQLYVRAIHAAVESIAENIDRGEGTLLFYALRREN